MTYQTYPLAPAPSHFAYCTQVARNGIYYVGDTVSITLSQATPTSYTVRHGYTGDILATGAVSGTTLNLGSSFDPGPYRVYLTGPLLDTRFGYSYGVTNFTVIRPHDNFPTLPASIGGYYGAYYPSGTGGSLQAITDPGNPDYPHNFDSPVEMITRGCLGLGVGRLTYTGVSNWDTLAGNASFATEVLGPWWLEPSNPDFVDPVRDRAQWMSFPNYATVFDYMNIPTDSAGYGWLSFFAKTLLLAQNGDKIFVSCEDGTSIGTKKVKIYYPNASTVVETYDNLSLSDFDATVATINASSYVVATRGQFTTAHNCAATAIGKTYRDTLIDFVQTLYPLGVTRYEGPINEPSMQTGTADYFAQSMRVFADAVHEGHPDAKVLGPCCVDITQLDGYRLFGDAGGFDHLDEISFHDYNTCVNGDINQARNTIENFLDMLAEYGADTKPRWQTEANHVITSVVNVYHPRKSRTPLLRTLIWEQYGVPFERNPLWYDWSHGFWGYASFLFGGYAGDKTMFPWGSLLCTYAQEVFGKAYHHHVDFGCVLANKLFAGNVYGDATTASVMALAATSAMPGSTVTLTINGSTDPIVTVDGFGVESTATQTAGRITVDVPESGAYVRLPAGVNAWVYSVKDWGHTPNVSISAAKASAILGGTGAAEIANDELMGDYTGGEGSEGIAFSPLDPPDSAEVKFGQDVVVDRVIVFCGATWQAMPGLIDYDIDTWDGSTWTTRETVTRTDVDSFWHGSAFTNAGCQRETFWDERWIEDVKLASPVTCKGVRVYVRETTPGGEPDADCVTFNGLQLGQGIDPCPLAIQEISIISPTTPSFGDVYWVEVEADNPVALWKFGEPSGTTAASEDNSPTLDGTYAGDYTLGNQSPISDGTTCFFSGTSAGVITVPDNNLLDVGDTFTLESWVYSNRGLAGQQLAIVKKGNNTFNLDIIGGIHPVQTGQIRLQQETVGTIVLSTVSLLALRWYHVACTKNGSDVHLYLNGVDVTGTVTNLTIGNSATELRICGTGYSGLSGTAIYPTVLSADRILAHYVSAISPPVPAVQKVPVVEFA